MIEKRDCKIVQDLLPNYIEKLTNEETNTYIKEHLKECSKCQEVLENMQKNIKISKEKIDGREVDYIKKYNKKMKLWKKISLIILGVIIIYLISIVYKYNILLRVEEKNEISNSSTNYYYNSISDDTIMEYFKKDNIVKINLRKLNGDGDITLWKDNNTGEELCLWNTPKIYSEKAGSVIDTMPTSIINTSDFVTRLSISVNPLAFIGTTKYNNVSCYSFKFDNLYEIVEKETGLVLYSSDSSYIRNVKYNFNIVTDDDVKKPDISEYTLNK